MADKMTFMKKWIDDIRGDDNLKLGDEEMAYIIYAAVMYGVYGEKVNMGDVFGGEYRWLNMAMPNIYGQIDNIQSYDVGRKTKYDSEAIKELCLKGYTAVQICEELGYDVNKARSLTSNKGWKEAKKLLAEKRA